MTDKDILGLNIIVGPDDKDVMVRCLDSCKGELLDEIIITMAMPKESSEVRAAAEKYTDKIFFFKWIEDFGAARNFSFSNSTTKHILWLDSDDIIKPEDYKALLELKPKLVNWDVIICDYVYSHDDKDNPVLVLPRERIVRNCPEIKWHDPIHEYMNLYGKQHKTNIKIHHYRVKPHNPARNIETLGKIYESGNASERIKFYYGKELSDYGSWNKALPVLESYINDGKDFRDNLTVACIKVAKHYYDKRDFDSAKNYALKGIRFNSIYAENYVILGSIYEYEKMIEPAEQYYKEALKKTLDGGMSQLVDYYGFIPCAKLALLYFNKKDYEEGMKYADKALEYKPDNGHMKEISKAMRLEIERLSKGITLKETDIKAIENFLKSINLNMSVIKNNIDFSDIRLKKIKDLEIVWMIPFVEISNPSVRIRRYNVAVKMRELGINSRIMTEYYGRSNYEIRNDIGDATVVIFTSHHKFDIELIKHLRTAGITCVYDQCEAIFGHVQEKIFIGEVDLVTCCSTKLESLLNERGYMKTRVIKDAIEEKYPKKGIEYRNRYDRPKAVYMGMGGNSFLVTEHLKDVIEEAGYDLVVISEWDNATIKWNINTWPDNLVECDVALCPQRIDIQPAKSSIKVTTAMALGLPVIASPLQSYIEIIKDGVNGFICDDKRAWFDVLLQLRDPELRKKIGEAGKKSVSNYDLTTITKKWEEILLDLINGRLIFKKPPESIDSKNRSIVDIIITSYNNPEYLRICVTSILMNTLHPFHLIISDGGSDEETWKYLRTLKGVTIIGNPNKRLTFSETCNAGIMASRTKYFVILNSDVIASKYWLTNLVNKMDTVPRLAACGVLSNCDRGWLFDDPRRKDSPSYPMKLERSGINLHPGMKIDEIKPNLEELYQFMAQSNERYKNTFIKQEWVATYATAFARSAINEIGLFDPLYKNGCEDLDLMIRLRKYGYEIGQSIDSFIFHFGGISRGAYELEDIKSYHKEDVENHQKHRLKWDRKRIVIWTGPAWESWNKETVDAGMAGSETWAAYLAREFVKMGYRTTIYNDLLIEDKNKAYIDPVLDKYGKKIGDVIYRDFINLKKDVEFDLIDYFISSRSLEPLKANIHSVQNYVMIHDIWLSGDKNYDVMQWRVDKYAYLSEWHRKFIMQHHGIPPHKMFLTANGVVGELYKNVNRYKKKNMTVYSSSPDRGLYQLLQMLPKIREEVPDFEVVVAYGFLNWESMAKMKNDSESMLFIDKIKKMMDQPGVNYVDRVSKKELAEYEMRANVWLYPTWFTETHCCHPDNEIATDTGFKKIIDLNMSDRVLTHENRFKKIEKILSRRYYGLIYSLKVKNHGKTGRYTEEHPILCIKGVDGSKRKTINNGIKEEWLPIKELRGGDWVCIPTDKEDYSSMEYYYPLDDMKKINRNYRIIDGYIRTRRGEGKNLPEKIKIDNNFARFLGFYLSEGSFSGGCLKFHFNINELEYINFIKEYINETFGYTCEVKTTGNCSTVICYFNAMGEWLKLIFGREASKKDLPYFVFSQNNDFVRSFIKGVMDGDGNNSANERRIELSSKNAIMSLKLLMCRIKLYPSFRESTGRGDNKYYCLGISHSLWNDLYGITSNKQKNYRIYIEHNNRVFYKIEEINIEPYDGYVYNLDVEEDHSYTSNFIAVHNCITAIENGFAKNPILTTDLGGLQTTVGSSGILLPVDGLSRNGNYPESYTNKFIEEAIKLIKDEDYRKEWADKAYNKMQEYTWDKIAQGWIEQFKS